MYEVEEQQKIQEEAQHELELVETALQIVLNTFYIHLSSRYPRNSWLYFTLKHHQIYR